MNIHLAQTAIDYFLNYDFATYAMIAGLCVATAASLLSVLVVLKRLAFVGQGVSHSAFAGIGLAAFLGAGPLGIEVIVFASCIASALMIGWMGRVRGGGEDTAIGIVLVAAMGLGFLLLGLRSGLDMMNVGWYRTLIADAAPMSGLDEILFGSILTVGPAGAWQAIALLCITAAAVWWFRRPLMVYLFDETAARAIGLPVQRLRIVSHVLLALIVAVGMKLIGVVLISALLVVPGAIALNMTSRMGPALTVSWCSACAGVFGGLVLSLEFDQYRLPPGACIVLLLVILYAASVLFRRVRDREGGPAAA